jgi:hypothetical protein
MNKYHLEVIGSTWPVKEVVAEGLECKPEYYKFTVFDSGLQKTIIVASYPTSKTIITEIEYGILEY